VTADVYTRRLGSICTLRGTNPSELVTQGRKDEEWLCNFLMDLVSELERQGKAGSYIASNLKAIKSWLSHNGVEFKRRIKVRGADDTPTLRGKHTLTTGQLVTSLISKVTVSPGSISTAGLWLLPTVVEDVAPYGVVGQLVTFRLLFSNSFRGMAEKLQSTSRRWIGVR